MRASLAILAISAAVSGCSATIELNKLAADPARKVALQDMRPADEKVYRRDGTSEPIQYFGDEDFDSSPLSQFSVLLAAELPPGAYDLQVSKFRVADIFPQRLSAGTAGAIAGVLTSMGYAAYFYSPSGLSQDNITCLVSGSINAKPINQSASVPYKISPLAGMVKNDPAFKGAANQCLGMLATKVAKSL